MIRYSRHGRLLLVLLVVALLAMPTHRALGKEGKDMLVPVLVDGKPSQILQKVIVVNKNARLLESPGSRNNSRLKPCQIFYRMKADDGSLEATSGKDIYWRVGDSEGREKGWVDKDFLTLWNTRFVLDPLGIATQDKPFKLFAPGDHDELGEITAGVGEYSLAFVTDRPQDDEEFPVAVYIGPITDRADESDETALGIDVAFVLEMSDFAFFQWPPDNKRSVELIQEIISRFAAIANERPAVKGRVRFAVVQYQDTAGKEGDGPLFISEKVTDFVTSEQTLRTSMQGLRPKVIGGDWPEDGLAGIKLAIDGLAWGPNSTKHIVLIGAGPIQDRKKGEQLSMFGSENNPITMPNDGVNRKGILPYGWSSTGLDIRGITAVATQGRNTAATEIDGLKAVKTIHAILVGKPPEQVPEDIRPMVENLLQMNEQQLMDELNERVNPNKALDALVYFAVMKLNHDNRSIAERHYRELSENAGGARGVYFAAPSTREGTDQAAKLLIEKMSTAFEDMEAAFGGAAVSTKNEFSESLVRIAQKYREQYKDKTVMTGVAFTRNDSGREVSKLKVLVYRDELVRLQSSLKSILQNFTEMDAKEKKDVGKTLEILQRAIAGGAAGQTFDEKTTLASVIGDLPMKTPVLATTAKAIASMSSDEFNDWMAQLQFGIDQCDALLKSQFKADFAFLEQSQLP
jgi:predicted transcriptional regulator